MDKRKEDKESKQAKGKYNGRETNTREGKKGRRRRNKTSDKRWTCSVSSFFSLENFSNMSQVKRPPRASCGFMAFSCNALWKGFGEALLVNAASERTRERAWMGVALGRSLGRGWALGFEVARRVVMWSYVRGYVVLQYGAPMYVALWYGVPLYGAPMYVALWYVALRYGAL